jgi:hypothetical protein
MATHRPDVLDPPLLITEDRAKFTRIYEDLCKEFNRPGEVEKSLIFTMAQSRFERERYARCEAASINVCFRDALANILTEVLRGVDEWPFEAEEDAETIAALWFTDKDTKQKISRLLQKLNLDESAIVAKAMELAEPQLGPLQHLMRSAESRFYRALRVLEDYRAGRLRHPVAPTIDGEVIESTPRARLSGSR